jgi:reticulon-4-interacting protein 1, mitochondrial
VALSGGADVTASSLWCTGTGFEVRREQVPRPKKHEIVVRVQASSVNPIDAKRAAGYGRRVLSLLGAGSLPRVLGNDFAGIVEGVGKQVRSLKEGDAVFGLVPTGPRGAHASHLCVDARWARRAPPGQSPESLSVLPYSFTTAWRAVHGAGLARHSAPGRRVVVLGAGGGLGRLATAMLSSWGANVTAVASPAYEQECMALGAREFVARDADWSGALARGFDAALNFAAWELDDAASRCLAPKASGQATTVHPLLDTFDRSGWVVGAVRVAVERWASSARVRRQSPGARYSWTLFAPTPAALDELVRTPFQLPIGGHYGFTQASAAFAHVRAGIRTGRVVLFPD